MAGEMTLTWPPSTPAISLQHTYSLPLSSRASAVGPMPPEIRHTSRIKTVNPYIITPESCENTVVTYAPSGRRLSRRTLFSTGYKKKLEYTFEKPVQIPMEMQNPMVIYDKNTFYPEPSFDIRKNKNFITYPLQQNYTENGLPTYTYPYKTMNPIFQDPTQDITDSIETFDNKRHASTSIFFVLLLIVILMIFLYMR